MAKTKPKRKHQKATVGRAAGVNEYTIGAWSDDPSGNSPHDGVALVLNPHDGAEPVILRLMSAASCTRMAYELCSYRDRVFGPAPKKTSGILVARQAPPPVPLDQQKG